MGPAMSVGTLLRPLLFGVALLALGCERASPAPLPAAPEATHEVQPVPAPTAVKTELVIFAAASLKGAFEALSQRFEASHPGADVQFNFAGTQEIRMQLEHGAHADLFASADVKHMQALVERHLVETPLVFAENEPVLVVYAGSKVPIAGLAELPSASRLVFGAIDVPIGRYTTEILNNAEQKYGAGYRKRVESRVVSRELNVRQVLAKVTLGEADAAIVYRSDVTPARQQISVTSIPKELNVVAHYPIAVVQGARHAALARAWLELLRSAEGRASLLRAGFRSPDGS